MLRKTFLYRIYKRDKPLFTLLILFIAGQLFFTCKHVENTPFYHFGMYTDIVKPQAGYTVYSMTVDTGHVRCLDFPDYQRTVVYSTLSKYDGLKQLHFKDSLDKVISKRFTGHNADILRASLLNNAAMDTPYQHWLFQYIADMRMVRTPVIEVRKQEVSYMPDGTLTPHSPAETLFKLRDE